MKNLIIVITGLPGVGKTTLAKYLSQELKIPYFARDEFKELLFDNLGVKDREWSREIGGVAYELLFHCLRNEILANKSIIVESNFSKRAGLKLLELQNEFNFNCIQIKCFTDNKTRKDRFQLRWESGERHKGHQDNENMNIGVDGDGNDILQINGPIINIDTTDFERISYGEIINKIKEYL